MGKKEFQVIGIDVRNEKTFVIDLYRSAIQHNDD